MNRYFQWAINALVIFMFIGWWVWPFIESYIPYEDDYVDETTPDEVAALDAEIDDVLLIIEPNFQELYDNQSIGVPPTLTYLKAPLTTLSNQDNYAKSVESIVYISTEDADGWVYFGSGSILTEDGIIMTNHHVIEGSIKVVVTTNAGNHYPAVAVLASDALLDVAFLKIDAHDLSPLPIGNADDIRVGDDTLVIGHAEGFLNTLSVGNVAGIRSYHSQGAGTNIQVTNPISAGNSGGAVINEYGEIIAIPTWSVEYDQNIVQVQNLNFAVPIDEALELLI